jgi:glyceraldehyde-3-phosphate dehydrogenase (NADP+)
VLVQRVRFTPFSQEYKREVNLVWPMLVDNVTDDMRLAWEEPFGPVVPIKRFKHIEEAIQHCNVNRLALQVRA